MYNTYLRVGDKVKIRSLSWHKNFRDSEFNVGQFVKEMIPYCGKIATIVRVNLNNSGDRFNFHLDIDGEMWNWLDSMFDPKSLFQYYIRDFCSNCSEKSELGCDLCLFKHCDFNNLLKVGRKVTIRPFSWFKFNEFIHIYGKDLIDLYSGSDVIITEVSRSSKDGCSDVYEYKIENLSSVVFPDIIFDPESYFKYALYDYCRDYCVYSDCNDKCNNCLLKSKKIF